MLQVPPAYTIDKSTLTDHIGIDEGEVLPNNTLTLHGPISDQIFGCSGSMPGVIHSKVETTTLGRCSLVSLAGEGSLWTTFRVRITGYLDTKDITSLLILKLQCGLDSAEMDSLEISEGIKNHLHTSRCLLKRHQGISIPRLHGVYVCKLGQQDMWALLEEDAGDPIELTKLLYHEKWVPFAVGASSVLTGSLTCQRRLEIIKHYKAFHVDGVIQGDPAPRNWLVRRSSDRGIPRSCIMITDFNKATYKSKNMDDENGQDYVRTS